jgi:tripartite-type tricarboxylate transporter receptor subunit TctC
MYPVTLLTMTIAIFAIADNASAQSYPARPVRVVVPYTPGGITDVVTRLVSQEMGKALKQTFLVDNRPGANSIVGADIVAKAQPDGYTIGTVIAAHAANQTLYPKLPFHSVNSFTQISLLATAPLIFVANPSLPANNVKELIALARAKPGALAFGSSGIGAAAHLTTELLMSTTGIRMNHVPYKGTAPALQDLMGGQIAVLFDVASSMMPHVKSGKIKALGMAAEKRAAVASDVPTFIEQGLAGFVSATWVALQGPAGLPRPITDRLSQEAAGALRLPEVRERLATLGIDPVGGSPDEYRKFVQAEVEKWAKVIKTAGVKVE